MFQLCVIIHCREPFQQCPGDNTKECLQQFAPESWSVPFDATNDALIIELLKQLGYSPFTQGSTRIVSITANIPNDCQCLTPD